MFFNISNFAGMILCPSRLKKFVKWKFSKNNDVIVISFPKSGRTWLRIMLDKLNIFLNYSHDGSSPYENSLHYSEMEEDKSKYKNNRIIFLIREPKDVTVSLYFQMTKRADKKYKNIHSFFRNEKYGIKRVLKFYQIWEKNKNVPKDFLLITYEDLHKNTLKELKRVIDFLDVKVSDKKLKSVIKFADFNNMKRLEKQGFFKKEYGSILTPKNKKDKDSYKVRKGKIKGYIDYLNKKDLKYCKKVSKKIKNNFY